MTKKSRILLLEDQPADGGLAERELRQAEIEANDELEQIIEQRTAELAKINLSLQEEIAGRKRAETALGKREKELADFVDNATVGLHRVDGNGIILWANKAELELLGYTAEEYIGQHIADFHYDSDVIDDILRRLTANEELRDYEARLRCKDGSIKYVFINSNVYREDGKFIHTRCFTRDVTDRSQAKEELNEAYAALEQRVGQRTSELIAANNLLKDEISERRKIEEELKANEMRLAEAQRIAQIGSWEWNIVENKVIWSDELFRIFGLSPQEFGGTYEAYFSRLHPDDQEFVSQNIESALSEKKYTPFEHRIIRPDKEVRIIQASGFVEVDETGNPIKMTGIVQDITGRKKVEDALRESEERFRSFMNNNPAIAFMKDEAGRYVYINKTMERVFNLKMEDMLGRTDYDWLPEAAAANVCENDRKVLAAGKTAELIETAPAPDGSERKWLTFKFPVGDALGNKFIGGTAIDVTDRERDKIALHNSEYRLRTLVENMSEGLLQVDSEDAVEYVNDCFCEMVGYSSDELIGINWGELLLDDDGRDLVRQAVIRRRKGISDRYELRLKKKTGEILWAIVGGSPTLDADGNVVGSMGVFTDITERKRAEEQLLHDAFHDGLTGLANRALFMDHLRMTIKRGRSRHSNAYAVLFLDFDRFKIINDSLGHAEGDKLLQSIAGRLESSVRNGDLVARLGGDEFVILLSELLDTNEALLIAERIQNDLRAAFEVGEREIVISASIGVTLSSAGHTTAEEMLRDADIAMYHAKENGRAQYRIFDGEMHERASKQLQLESEMHRAFKRKEFRVHYQPIFNLETESLIGFESLIRWRHPERGMIPPDDFIPAAEENGLIIPLGRWILRESCRQLRQWQDYYPAASRLSVSVNLSSKEFLQFDLAEQIAKTLEITKLDPKCLKLEITESHVMENSETSVTMMNRLRSLGVELSLDDFGTGYSSLSYLHRLPVSFLKIDRSFVMQMEESKENKEIAHTIIKLAQNLKMQVIAEGIETAEQLAQLRHLKCEYGQGYFFSKPLEAEKAESFIGQSEKNIMLASDSSIINLDMNM